MIVGDLFVKLGIDGAKDAKKALSGVNDGMKKFRLAGIAVAGATIGMVAGLAKLTASSNAYGAALLGFGTSTGQSIKKLQEWQRAGREAHATNEEVAQSISSVNKAMAQIALGRNVPSGWAAISGAVGGIDYERAKGDTFYMMRQLQKYAKDFKNLSGGLHAEGNAIDFLKSFGLTDNVITGMMRGVFNKKNFGKANLYTDWETQRLSKMKVQWETLFDGIEKAIGRINVKFSKHILTGFETTANAFLSLMEGAAQIMEFVQTGKSKDMQGFSFREWLGAMGAGKSWLGDFTTSQDVQALRESNKRNAELRNNKPQQILNFNFHGDNSKGLPPSDIDNIRKSTEEAFRQSPAHTRGN